MYSRSILTNLAISLLGLVSIKLTTNIALIKNFSRNVMLSNLMV